MARKIAGLLLVLELRLSLCQLPDQLEEVLEYHNMYRCLHGMPHLAWSPSLATKAEERAADLTLAGPSAVSPLPAQNVAYRISSMTMAFTGRDAVESWYNEIEHTEPYGLPPRLEEEVASYARLARRDAATVGCGRSGASKELVFADGRREIGYSVYWVCLYGKESGELVNEGQQVPAMLRTTVKGLSECGLNATSVHSGWRQEVVNWDGVTEPERPAMEESEVLEGRTIGDLLAPEEEADERSFAEKIVEKLNKYRCYHGAPTIQWNVELETLATEWLNGRGWDGNQYRRLFDANTKKKDFFYVVRGAGNSIEGEMAKSYRQGVTKNGTLHFMEVGAKELTYAQLVWRSARNIGCSSLSIRSQVTIWSCMYDAGPGWDFQDYRSEVLPFRTADRAMCGLTEDDVGRVAATRSVAPNDGEAEDFFVSPGARVTKYTKTAGAIEASAGGAGRRSGACAPALGAALGAAALLP